MLWSILHYPGWQKHALMPKPIPSSACGAALAQGQCPPEAGIACLHPCLPGGAWGGQEGGNWQHSSALIRMLQHFHRVLVCLCAPACICQLLRVGFKAILPTAVCAYGTRSQSACEPSALLGVAAEEAAWVWAGTIASTRTQREILPKCEARE